jgi:DNA-binding transcriptional ArsR family regulator
MMQEPTIERSSDTSETIITEPSTEENVIAHSPTWRQGEHRFPDPLLDLIAERFRLLGEPLRLKLLAALATGERSVGDLVALTTASQPNVSKHLAALAAGGLVRRRKSGTTIYYALTDPSILTLCDAVCSGIQQRFALQARALGLPAGPAEDHHEQPTISS